MVNIFLYSIIFLFGLAVGSFLNSIIHRLHTGEGFLISRSHCPHCKHILKWKDLIPLISFLLLKGKCRYCKKPVSLQYPLVELGTGILFVLIFAQNITLGLDSFTTLQLFYYLLITCFLIVIFIYDLKHFLIPDKIIYPAIIVTFLYNIFYSYSTLHTSYFILNTLGAAFLSSAFFLSIVLISREKWMGLGDVKLSFFLGLFLGFPKVLIALFLAFFLGALVGLILILTGKKTLKSKVPFAPFLITGTFLTLFLEEVIFDIIIL